MEPKYGRTLQYVVDSYARNTARQKCKKINRRAAEIAQATAFRGGINPVICHAVQKR